MWKHVLRDKCYQFWFVSSLSDDEGESDVNKTLDLFLGQYGVPESLISDEAMAYTGGELK